MNRFKIWLVKRLIGRSMVVANVVRTSDGSLCPIPGSSALVYDSTFCHLDVERIRRALDDDKDIAISMLGPFHSSNKSTMDNCMFGSLGIQIRSIEDGLEYQRRAGWPLGESAAMEGEQ